MSLIQANARAAPSVRVCGRRPRAAVRGLGSGGPLGREVACAPAGLPDDVAVCIELEQPDITPHSQSLLVASARRLDTC
jgi:hypothetical protein